MFFFFFFSQQRPFPIVPNYPFMKVAQTQISDQIFQQRKKSPNSNVRPYPNGGTNKPINHSQKPKFQSQSQTSTSRSLTKTTEITCNRQ
jgi:hypothetical protein